MKLLRLHVDDYYVLRDLNLVFNEEKQPPEPEGKYRLNVLVGLNGTGKSTVLRALAEIFRRLYGDSNVADFGFEIEYLLDSSERISVSASKAEADVPVARYRLVVDKGPEQFVDQVAERYLPSRVIAFTTGSEAEWLSNGIKDVYREDVPDSVRSLPEQELFYREIPDSITPVLESTDPLSDAESRVAEVSSFRLIRSWQMPLVTLCGLLADRHGVGMLRKAILNELNIKQFAGFSLKFRMTQANASPSDRRAVLQMASLATRALQSGSDYMLVFELTDEAKDLTKELVSIFSNPIGLFDTLCRLADPATPSGAVLRETNLFLSRGEYEGVDESITLPIHLLPWLSDGERSFLGRMCLLAILNTPNALIMLDEPEVHFNDYWKREMVFMIDALMKDSTSHILLATHSSIVLSDVSRERILILSRRGAYTSQSRMPPIQTFAAEPGDIMMNIFGTAQAAGAQSVTYIQRLLGGLEHNEREREERRQELLQLLRDLAPGYWSYRVRQKLLELES